MHCIPARRVLFLALFIGCSVSVFGADLQKTIDWRTRQVMANFDNKNEAAPIHFRQLHQLYPTRKIANLNVTPLGFHAQQLKLVGVNYAYGGKELPVNDYIDRIRATGLLVIKGGKITHESYYHGSDVNSTMIAFSTSKSIVGLLVGIAIDSGLISDVSDPIINYIPELKGSGYEGASIKNVLQMTAALSFPGEDTHAGGQGRDIRGATIHNLAYGQGGMRSQPQQAQKKVGAVHGDAWEYLNTNTQLLTVLLERVTGKTVSAYMEEKIWKKIGAEAPAYWLIDSYTDAGAIEHGWMGFMAGLRDFGRIGLMMANKGRWNGETIIPENWVRESTVADNPAVETLPGYTSLGYGYQWWIPHGDMGEFMSVGHAGQIIYINPVHDAVIVQTSADPVWAKRTKEEAVVVFRSLIGL